MAGKQRAAAQRDTRSAHQRIEQLYPRLSRSEKRVADHVLAAADQVVYESISQCAEASGVSEPTVIRFSRSLGFGGYQDLKIALAKELVSPTSNVTEELRPEDDMDAAVGKVANMAVHTLQDTRDLLSLPLIAELAQRLWRCHSIVLTAVGTSGIAAEYLHYKLLRLGLPSHFNADPHRQLVSIGLLKEGDICVAISQSGATKETLAVAEVAKGQQASLVAVTSYANSPLGRLADTCVLTCGRETPFGSGSGSTLMSQLLVAECLFVAAAWSRREQALAAIEQTGNAVKQQKI